MWFYDFSCSTMPSLWHVYNLLIKRAIGGLKLNLKTLTPSLCIWSLYPQPYDHANYAPCTLVPFQWRQKWAGPIACDIMIHGQDSKPWPRFHDWHQMLSLHYGPCVWYSILVPTFWPSDKMGPPKKLYNFGVEEIISRHSRLIDLNQGAWFLSWPNILGAGHRHLYQETAGCICVAYIHTGASMVKSHQHSVHLVVACTTWMRL